MTELPLSGVRIIEFTWIGVGPYCTFLCALMGAECIRIETTSRPIHYRGLVRLMDRDPRTGKSINDLNQLNANKLSACINLKHAEGVELVKRLAAVSDVVAENYQAGVMDRLGVGYSELSKVNPAIIMLSMSAHGAVGPEKHGKGLAAVFGALGGVSHLSGYEDGPPVELRLAADLVSGTAACFALLTGLQHTRKTGVGTWIDCSSREVMSLFAGEALLDAMVNGRDQPRVGNRDSIMAPHNVYPCAETGSWISIAVANQEEWKALCGAVGHQEWLEDARFGDQFLRWHYQDALDQMLQEWSRQQNPQEAMTMLQEAGVPATASSSTQDLLGDPHLSDRGVFETAADEDGVPYIMMGFPWKYSGTVPQALTRPPRMGEHNRYVFQELLGMDEPEVQDLHRRGVIV